MNKPTETRESDLVSNEIYRGPTLDCLKPDNFQRAIESNGTVLRLLPDLDISTGSRLFYLTNVGVNIRLDYDAGKRNVTINCSGHKLGIEVVRGKINKIREHHTCSKKIE